MARSYCVLNTWVDLHQVRLVGEVEETISPGSKSAEYFFVINGLTKISHSNKAKLEQAHREFLTEWHGSKGRLSEHLQMSPN